MGLVDDEVNQKGANISIINSLRHLTEVNTIYRLDIFTELTYRKIVSLRLSSCSMTFSQY